jgi:hypothetical protein
MTRITPASANDRPGKVGLFAVALLSALLIPCAACSAGQPAAPWKPGKAADGQPDVSGFWTAELGGTYSLTNPRRGGGSSPPQWFLDKISGKKGDVKPSRITDPSDGEVPYQPWARTKQQYILANIDKPTKQEFIDPQARCFPDGVTRTLFWSGFEIQQYPGYVLFLFDGNHPYRVIPLDGRPHVHEKIQLWMSDSRARWEGNTLVVDVTNSNSKHRLSNEGDFASDKVKITQRFTFADRDTITYTETLTDPDVYTRPWTISATFRRAHKKDPDWEQWENSCHEGERSAESLFLGDKTRPEQKTEQQSN